MNTQHARNLALATFVAAIALCGAFSTGCDKQPTFHNEALCGDPDAAVDTQPIDAAPDMAPVDMAPPDMPIDMPPPDAWVCNPLPPSVFVDPAGQHPNVTIDKPTTYSCADAPRPLLIFLHSYGSDTGNGAKIRMGFRYTAKPHGDALILAPLGLIEPGTTAVRYWNADPSSSDKMLVGNDDVAYLRAMIQWAFDNYTIDRSRVMVLGSSNGGFMAERLRCEVSDLVTHMVDASGAGQTPTIVCPAGALPVHAIIDHSQQDGGVKYDGGDHFGGMTVDYIGTIETIAQNAAQSGCVDLQLTQALAYDHDFDTAGNDTDLMEHTTCTGAVVQHWRRPIGPHTFTGTFVDGCTTQTCNVPLQTKFAVDVWAFLQAHPRP